MSNERPTIDLSTRHFMLLVGMLKRSHYLNTVFFSMLLCVEPPTGSYESLPHIRIQMNGFGSLYREQVNILSSTREIVPCD